MTSDPAAYLLAFGGLIVSALAMGVGTFIIIKLDERHGKPKKKSTDA